MTADTRVGLTRADGILVAGAGVVSAAVASVLLEAPGPLRTVLVVTLTLLCGFAAVEAGGPDRRPGDRWLAVPVAVAVAAVVSTLLARMDRLHADSWTVAMGAVTLALLTIGWWASRRSTLTPRRQRPTARA